MNTSIWMLGALVVCGLVLACHPPEVAAVDYSKLIAEGATLVDVRSHDEFAGGSLPGAIHVPHEQAATRLDAFGAKDQPVVLFCAAGGRAGRVKKLLESKGWTHVHNAGGISDLQ
jgi:phage shock protein E